MTHKKYFITTAIPYINADAHIGHAQEFLLADTLKQILQKQGHEVLLQTGTDDNSLKNVLAAQKKGIPLVEYIAAQGVKFKNLVNKLNVKADYFVHTSSPSHHLAVQNFIKRIKRDDLYENVYQGLYCVGCEDFLKKEGLVDGCCPDHLVEPGVINEKNVFFKLSQYQEQIFNLIESNKIKIYPASRKKEILNFISQGLADISISRPIKGEKWGVDFPEQEGQTVYVWIDALINYLSGINYDSASGRKLWNESYKIHVIGKNVWKFHAIYWVALLLSSNIALPDEIIIHGFLTNEGLKISKSLGNGIDPLELIKTHEPDVVRTYLLAKLNYLDDADFKISDLESFYLQELVNQIGNLYPRIFSIASKFNVSLKREGSPIQLEFHDFARLYQHALAKSQFLNKEINDSLIWKKEFSPEIQNILNRWQGQLNEISDLLEILFPSKKDLVDLAFTDKTILFTKPSPKEG